MSALPESATMKSGDAAHPRSKLAFSSGVVPRWPVGVMILTVFMREPSADGEAANRRGHRKLVGAIAAEISKRQSLPADREHGAGRGAHHALGDAAHEE